MEYKYLGNLPFSVLQFNGEHSRASFSLGPVWAVNINSGFFSLACLQELVLNGKAHHVRRFRTDSFKL